MAVPGSIPRIHCAEIIGLYFPDQANRFQCNMVFVSSKSKQKDQFNLQEISAGAALRRRRGIELWHKLLGAYLLGAVLALSSPGFDQWWLAWFMVAPFLVLLRYCRGNGQSLLCGLFFGLGYHLLALRSYLGITSSIAGHGGVSSASQLSILIWFVQAFELSLPVVAFAWLVNSLPLRPGYLPYFKRPFFPYLIGVPILWIFLNWGLSIAHPIRDLWQWAPLPPVAIDCLAYSQYCQLQIVQLAKYIGPAGIEFLVLLVNAAIAAVCVELVNVQERPVERVDLISPRLGSLIDLGIAVLIVSFVYLLGSMELGRLIFGGVELTDKDYSVSELNQPQVPVGIVSFGSEAICTGPQTVASATSWSFDGPVYQRSLSQLGQYIGVAILAEPDKEIDFDRVGNIFKIIKAATRQNENSVIMSFISSQGADLIRHNVIFTPAGSYTGQQRLFNSVQFCLARLSSLFSLSPADNHFEQSLSWLFSSLPPAAKEWFGSSSDSDSSFKASSSIAKLNWGKCGLLGIAELTNPRLVANQIRNGASLLVCSTNISWTHYRCLSKQLLALGIFRAVENNRYVLLCTSDGTSAVIEPTGAIQALSFSDVDHNGLSQAVNRSCILGRVQFLWSKTPFTKMWWF